MMIMTDVTDVIDFQISVCLNNITNQHLSVPSQRSLVNPSRANVPGCPGKYSCMLHGQILRKDGAAERGSSCEPGMNKEAQFFPPTCTVQPYMGAFFHVFLLLNM